MEHSAYKELLSALLDGELSGAEREAALAHLETCADCRAYFDELAALRAALGGMEELDAPEGFAAGVMARLHADGVTARTRADGAITPSHAENAPTAPKPMKKRAAWRGTAALAACVAVVLLAVYALPNALRMGGGSVAQNSSIQAAPAASAPSGASGALSAPAEAPETAVPQDPAAPDPGESYVYAGSRADSGNMALESTREKSGHAADADLPAAANDSAEDGTAKDAAGGTAVVTAGGETGGERYATEDEKLLISGGGELPMAPLSRPEAWDEAYPVLTLTGADAESWLAEHGRQGESGAWYVEADALRALPENLTVVYSELPEDYDGAVLVWVAEP